MIDFRTAKMRDHRRVRMLHQLTLLFGRLDAHETHGWASDRLADRLGVSGIILVTLDISLHILRRQDSTGGKQKLGPISKQGDRYLRRILVVGAHAVLRRARQLTHGVGRYWGHRLPDDDILGRINTVNLEHVLGEIQNFWVRAPSRPWLLTRGFER